MCLSISREQFRQIYKGLDILQYEDIFYTDAKDNNDIITNRLPSKLWRLNNLYTIVNKKGTRVTFKMRRAQHIVYAESLRHPRIIVLKSRQQGISTLWLISFFDDAVFSKDLHIGLMAQGADEAEALLERTKLLWDTLSQAVKNFLKIRLVVNNTKEFKLSNGCKIFVRTSFRSATLQRLHISEMGKIANENPKKAKETKTGTLQTIAPGNTAVIESTAEGDNMFKEMWDSAVTWGQQLASKDFKPVFLSWLDDPDCIEPVAQEITKSAERYFDKLEARLNIKLTSEQKNFWVAQYRELGDDIYQEYPADPVEAFMATKQGNYYAEQYMMWVVEHNRIVSNLFDNRLDVQVAIDLGMNDTNVLTVFQTYEKTYRIIDEFADNGHMIKHYTDWMKEQPWFDNLTHVILPHDATVRDLTSGKTREEAFIEELSTDKNGNKLNRSITITVLERSDVNSGIENVRQMIGNLWIDSKIDYLKACLLNYKKEWNEKMFRFNNTPLHDEHSNGADSIRYMALGATRGTAFIARFRNRTEAGERVTRRSGGFDV